MHPDAPYFIVLLCLTQDDFTHQGKSAATQWVNQTICQRIFVTHSVRMHPDAPYFIIVATLSNTR